MDHWSWHVDWVAVVAVVVAVLALVTATRALTEERLLRIELSDHRALPIHPGAALSSVVQDMQDRLRALESAHADGVK